MDSLAPLLTDLIKLNKQGKLINPFGSPVLVIFFIRKVVADINARFPAESVEQRARRLIADQTRLSLLGGLILDLPAMIPGVGHALQILGFVGGTSALVRMHLYLILQIALLYGNDIDDQARVPEMLAVVAGTSLAVGAPFVADVLGLHPLWSMITGSLAVLSMSRLIGKSAIRYYSQPQEVSGDAALAASV